MVRTSKIWKISDKEFNHSIETSVSWAQVMEKLTGNRYGNTRVLKERVKEENIDISHFTHRGECKKPRKSRQIPLEDILNENIWYKSSSLRKRLIKEGLLENKCSECSIGPKWNGKTLVLQLDHINGCHSDNRLQNLRILCPNCHSQTETFTSKKLRKLDKKCTDCDNIIKRSSTRCPGCYHKWQKGRESKKDNKCMECDCPISKNASRCGSCSATKINETRRKVKDRPDLETLLKEVDEYGYSKTGKKYGVSDNCIRKWIRTSKKQSQ